MCPQRGCKMKRMPFEEAVCLLQPWYRDAELRAQRKRTWTSAVFVFGGRARLGIVFRLFVCYYIIIVSLIQVPMDMDLVKKGASAQESVTGMFGYDDDRRLAHDLTGALQTMLEALSNIPSHPARFTGVGLLFMVTYRTSVSYQKMIQARMIWSSIAASSRDLALVFSAYVKDTEMIERALRHIVLFCLSTRTWVRGDAVEQELLAAFLDERDLKEVSVEIGVFEEKALRRLTSKMLYRYQFENVSTPLVMLQRLREQVAAAIEEKKCGPWQMALESPIKSLESLYTECEMITSTNLPLGYVSQLRTAVIVYMMLLPFFIVNDLGWVTIVVSVFMIFVLVGLENLAVEVENAFGSDANDLPVERYCAEIAKDLRDILQRRRLPDAASVYPPTAAAEAPVEKLIPTGPSASSMDEKLLAAEACGMECSQALVA
eukprot:TRINITY_DN12901_c0_g1_i1.p1 TRINITY_DN12901_c0_g1~~TRINITY_DN12901_c0_g1_i1.p1  ORF type:complete len:432 (-),score=81.86 TRINITY_DN12901_c0_g1_i1:115-1410(-)